MTTVVHVRKCDPPFVQFTSNFVYIGRDFDGFKDEGFGNPFHLGKDGNRKEVLSKYRAYAIHRMQHDPEFWARVKNLKDKTLGCWCKPYDCHGDILAELAYALWV